MRKLLAIAAIVAAAAVFFLLRDPPVEPGSAPVPSVSPVRAPSLGPSPLVSATVPAAAAKPSPKAAGEVVRMIPSLESVRAEIARDPHAHPASYYAFASALAKRFDAAAATPEGSERILDELVECAESPEARELRPVRAVCVADIRLLAERRPEMAAKVERALRRIGEGFEPPARR